MAGLPAALDLLWPQRRRALAAHGRHAGLKEEAVHSAGGEDDQDPAVAIAHVLEPVHGAARDERESACRQSQRLIPVQDLELPVEHVPRLVLVGVHVRRRATARAARTSIAVMLPPVCAAVALNVSVSPVTQRRSPSPAS
jgi:hypothetical protein